MPSDLAALTAENAALRERLERAKEALEHSDTWSRTYPVKAFPEPDQMAAAAALEQAGMSLDAVSASAMRHVLEGVEDTVRAALALLSAESDGAQRDWGRG